MDSENQNEGAKSKIEKIRIDLERKLAALEAVKLKSIKKANLIVEKTEGIVKESDAIAESKVVDTNRSFIEQISDIENSSNFDNFKTEEIKEIDEENKISPIHVSNVKDFKEETIIEDKELVETSDKTFFEITDEIENVEDEILIKESVKIAPIIVKEQKESIKKEKLIAPIVATKIKEKIPVQNSDSAEEKPKSSNLNYLIYALVAMVIFGIGYLGWNYLSTSSKKKDKIFSEFENQKYKDSIELADAKNQLSDFISQRYIDSIANANQILLDNNNSSKRPTKSNINRPKNRPEVVLNNNLPSSSNIDVSQTTNSNPVNTDVKSSNDDVEKTTDNNNNNNNNNDITENSSNTTNDNSSEKPDVVVENNSETDTKPESAINKPKKTETLSTIEKSPVYPGCEKKGSELAKKKCLMSKVSRFVQNKFNGDLSQDLGLEAGRKKINVQFIIDKNGNATVLRVRGQHKVLEKEALRVVNSLPKMKPGRKNGKTEPVIYNLPIVYNVEY